MTYSRRLASVFMLIGACVSPVPPDDFSSDAGPDAGAVALDSGSPSDAGAAPDAEAAVDAGPGDAGTGPGVISCNPATVAEFTGTCLGSAFSCFAPQGSCTSTEQIETDGTFTMFTWTDGSTVGETSSPDVPFSLVVSGSGGQSCVSVRQAHSGACLISETEYGIVSASGATLATLCWNSTGPSLVICANAARVTVDNDSLNNVLQCLPVAPAVAQCTMGSVCAESDAGPSPSCCQPDGNSCLSDDDCCSGNCILRGSPGVCCVAGGCP